MRILLLAFLHFAIITNLKASVPDSSKVGFYITSIHDLDYINNSFSAEFWFWRVNKTKDLSEYYLFSPKNVKECRTPFTSKDYKDQSENVLFDSISSDTTFWDYEKYNCIFKHYFDISKYPFDEETLVIEIEELTNYDSSVYLTLDSVESGLYKDLTIKGRKIGKIRTESFRTVYDTDFGNPVDNKRYGYNGIRILIPIKREGLGLFLKLYTGLVVSFVIALFSLRINISEADARFGVCVGALFAAIANMYIVNSDLPTVAQMTLMDKVHIITVFLILVLFIVSTISLTFFRFKKEKKSKKLDKYAFISIATAFAILHTIVIIGSLI